MSLSTEKGLKENIFISEIINTGSACEMLLFQNNIQNLNQTRIKLVKKRKLWGLVYI